MILMVRSSTLLMIRSRALSLRVWKVGRNAALSIVVGRMMYDARSFKGIATLQQV